MGGKAGWRFIPSPPAGPAENMALDEALLRAEPVVPTLRTYAWAPWSLSLGYFQAARRTEIDRVTAAGYGLVRRMTGGGAIFHGDEVTYSVVWPLDLPGIPRDTLGSYRLFHGLLARALKRLGIPAEPRGGRRLLSDSTAGRDEFWCFYHSVPFDLAARGRKLVGSAQRRTARAFLLHGSIPLAANPFTPRAASAGAGREALEKAILGEWAATFGGPPEPSPPTAAERDAAARLAAERYSRGSFTFRRVEPEPAGNGREMPTRTC
jgi:lipoate-protein ligase A